MKTLKQGQIEELKDIIATKENRLSIDVSDKEVWEYINDMGEADALIADYKMRWDSVRSFGQIVFDLLDTDPYHYMAFI